jgi:hypothetical protein
VNRSSGSCAVGRILAERPNGLVPGHFHFYGIAAFQREIAADIVQHDPRNALSRLHEVYIVSVIRTEETDSARIEVGEAKLAISAKQSQEDAQDNNPENQPSADRTRRSNRPPTGMEKHLDQSDDADRDQKEWPIIRNPREGEQVGPDIVNQKENADKNDYQGPGNRTLSHECAPGSLRGGGTESLPRHLRLPPPKSLRRPMTINNTGHVWLKRNGVKRSNANKTPIVMRIMGPVIALMRYAL